jgi:hypothetical protein
MEGVGRVDAGVALSVVPIMIGLLVLAIRLGLPPLYEVPLALVLGVSISIGYSLASRLPGGDVLADALLRGLAVGLTVAGIVATIRRLLQDDRAPWG